MAIESATEKFTTDHESVVTIEKSTIVREAITIPVETEVVQHERPIPRVETEAEPPANEETTDTDEQSEEFDTRGWLERMTDKAMDAGEWLVGHVDNLVKPFMHVWVARVAAGAVVAMSGFLLAFSPIPGGILIIPIGLAIPFGVAPKKSWGVIKKGYIGIKNFIKGTNRFKEKTA